MQSHSSFHFLDDKETPMVVKIKAAKDMAIRW